MNDALRTCIEALGGPEFRELCESLNEYAPDGAGDEGDSPWWWVLTVGVMFVPYVIVSALWLRSSHAKDHPSGPLDAIRRSNEFDDERFLPSG
jgi:hypothetical protein